MTVFSLWRDSPRDKYIGKERKRERPTEVPWAVTESLTQRISSPRRRVKSKVHTTLPEFIVVSTAYRDFDYMWKQRTKIQRYVSHISISFPFFAPSAFPNSARCMQTVPNRPLMRLLGRTLVRLGIRRLYTSNRESKIAFATTIFMI